MANINTKLEYWKNRLLDLGKRNRLINCPLPKSGGRVSRTSLLINTPDTSELWDLFDEGSKALVFPIPPIELKLEEADNEVLSVFNNGIETNQTPSESYKTLHSLMKKAKEFNEEKGLNALHLAFGFLNWKENGAEGQEMRSPLLLMPVKLTQEDLFSPILLSRAEDELTANYSLEQKLISDFGIELPVLTEDTELNDYISKVKSAVSSLGWSVSTDVTHYRYFHL